MAQARLPTPAVRVALGLAAACKERGSPAAVTYVRLGGTRSEHAGEPARRISRLPGLAEHGGQCRRQAIAGKRLLIAAGFVTAIPAGGRRPNGWERGGRGWATGYAAGPAMGGPVIDAAALLALVDVAGLADEADPEPEPAAPIPALPPEVLERRAAERRAALEGPRARHESGADKTGTRAALSGRPDHAAELSCSRGPARPRCARAPGLPGRFRAPVLSLARWRRHFATLSAGWGAPITGGPTRAVGPLNGGFWRPAAAGQA